MRALFRVGLCLGVWLRSTLKDYWDAGVYTLALVQGSLTVGWAALRLLLLLFCCYVPPKYLKPHTRGLSLIACELLGKWLLLDFFLNMLVVVVVGKATHRCKAR
eukprot:1726493-Pleurochrysis_carterae.AAC.1